MIWFVFGLGVVVIAGNIWLSERSKKRRILSIDPTDSDVRPNPHRRKHVV